MKTKLTGLFIVLSMICGLPSYGSDENKAEGDASEEEQLKISREIIRLYSNLQYFKYWDPLAEEIGQAASRAGWYDAMHQAWGGTVAAASQVTVYRPQDAQRLAQFEAMRKRQNIVEDAIKKARIPVPSPEALKQALSEFLDLSRRRLQAEQLDQVYRPIPGRREYFLEEIASVVSQYHHALPTDKIFIIEKFEDLFAAIAPSALQTGCRNLQKESRCAYQQAISEAVAQIPQAVWDLVVDYAEANLSTTYLEYVKARKSPEPENFWDWLCSLWPYGATK